MNTTIEQQIEINHQAYLIASKSKKSTLQFLKDIGISKKSNLIAVSASKPRKRSTAKK